MIDGEGEYGEKTQQYPELDEGRYGDEIWQGVVTVEGRDVAEPEQSHPLLSGTQTKGHQDQQV